MSDLLGGLPAINQLDIVEDFLSRGTATQLIGSHGWDLSLSGGASGGTVVLSSQLSGDALKHPGVMSLRTGTSSGRCVSIFLGHISFDAMLEHTIVVRPELSVATMSFKVGCLRNAAIAPETSTGYGMYFSFLPAISPNWRCVTQNIGDGAVVTTTGVAYALATWYTLTVRRVGASTIQFFINRVLVATHTTGIPSAAEEVSSPPSPVLSITTLEGADKRLEVDFYHFSSLSLSPRD